MSDAQDPAPDASALPPLPNLVVEVGTTYAGGRQSVMVTWGTPPNLRRIEVLKPDLGDQLDLAEMADTSVMNLQWLSLAMVGLAVKGVNGVPVPVVKSKSDLKNNLRQIGEDGLRAVQHALAQDAVTSADALSAAGNSPGTPASAR